MTLCYIVDHYYNNKNEQKNIAKQSGNRNQRVEQWLSPSMLNTIEYA